MFEPFHIRKARVVCKYYSFDIRCSSPMRTTSAPCGKKGGHHGHCVRGGASQGHLAAQSIYLYSPDLSPTLDSINGSSNEHLTECSQHLRRPAARIRCRDNLNSCGIIKRVENVRVCRSCDQFACANIDPNEGFVMLKIIKSSLGSLELLLHNHGRWAQLESSSDIERKSD